MTELNIVEITVAVFAVISLVELVLITRLFRNANEDRSMLMLLLKDSLKAKMVEMQKELENLMNHKNENKSKTNDKVKHKN